MAALPQYLPWTPGRSIYVFQGNSGRYTHFKEWSQFAWDFALPIGSEVVAGIGGVVERTGAGCPVIDSEL